MTKKAEAHQGSSLRCLLSNLSHVSIYQVKNVVLFFDTTIEEKRKWRIS